MSDLEFLDDTEQDVSESHSKLLDAVSQLDKGQRVKKAERSEPTLEVSEFHLVKSGISDVDTVQIHDLAKVLGKKGHHLHVTKTIKSAKRKIHTLRKPLEKPAAERIKRIVGFENTKKELKKWNAIITKNRTADALHFPLNQSSMKLEPSTKFIEKFRLQSELEKELSILEPQKENIDQKHDEFSLTLKEIIMKRKEAARIRAQQSYKEAKARRQNKIKSKKFHRIQKKQKIRLQLKEFQQLQKTDPEAALEKLKQLDKSRAEERMSLRHKNTGKWAKSKQIMAKYDKETRQELAQQLSISRDLTQKLNKSNDEDEEEGEEEEEDINNRIYVESSVYDKENPWISNTKTASEIDQFINSYRKYWNDRNNQLTNKKEFESEVKQTKISSKTSKDSNISEGQNGVNIESFKTQNQKDNEKITESNEQLMHNSCNEAILQKKLSKSNKKMNEKTKLHNANLSNIIATSIWTVESLENNNIQHIFNSLSSNNSTSEKINNMFDIMEDKMYEQIKLKLQRVTQKYSKVPGKKNKIKNINFEKDNFDGLETQAKKQKPIIDSSLDESFNKKSLELNIESENIQSIKYDNSLAVDKSIISEMEIDPNKYINVKPKQLNTDLPIDPTGNHDVLDDTEDEEERHNLISEAFADDDVVEEFRKEKKEEVEKSRPKNIDLTLPGWGSWGGKDVKKPKRKRKRLILKVTKDLPRKDENKGDVIIFEEDKSKIKEHLVNELPYPFTTVQDYEASIRMPIGRNFVPENSFKTLIKPPIKTTMGKVIEPMSDQVLIKSQGKIFKKKK